MAEEPGHLKEYLKDVAQITPGEFAKLSEDDQKALWLNVYNAFTIKVVLDHYPISGNRPYFPADSIRQIKPDAWESFKVSVAGKEYTLYELEHDILRKVFHNARSHFAVVCASRGSAALRRQAFVGRTLNQDLTDCAEKFLSEKRNLDFDAKKKTVTVSMIFQWFPLDFVNSAGLSKHLPPPTDDQIVLAYLAKHAALRTQRELPQGDDISTYKVIYKPFDWSLNDADAVTKTSDAQKP